MNFINKILISTLAVIITAYFLSGVTLGNNQFFQSDSIELNKFVTALLVAIVLAFLNTIIKPIITILSFPITIITFGLFLLVINTVIVLLASKLVEGFVINGFWTAFWFSVLLSIVNSIIEWIGKDKKKDDN